MPKFQLSSGNLPFYLPPFTMLRALMVAALAGYVSA
jgi:hypothetical protein